MLPLTRPYRQAIATLGLFLFTVVPTAYVGFTAYRINRPGHVRDVEIEMRRSLGLQVTLKGVRYPTPGEVVYEGIVLRQEEQRKSGLTEVARADSIRLRKVGRNLALEAVGLKLHGPTPRGAMAQVETLLGRSGDGPFEQVSLTAPSCLLELGESGNGTVIEVRELAATFRNDRATPNLLASYRVVSSEGSSRCELELIRDRRVEPVSTQLAFKTMEGVPLPARMLDLFFDSAEWVGVDARVQGALTLRHAGTDDWNAQFSGELIDVDLTTVFTKRFPRQRMTGLAHVSVKNAVWDDRPGQGFGWAEIDGELVTGPGSAGFDFLRSITKEMNFRVTAPIQAAKPDVSFKTLALKFKLSRDGQIGITGALPSEYAPDDILVINDRPVIKAPQGTANVRGLIKVLHPGAADTMVPISAESQMLSRFLPLPKGAPLDPSTIKTLNAN